MDKNFADKTVIITGSSSGIGAGVAVEFAKRGANLILTGRNVDQLNNVKNQCIEAGLKENQVVVVAGEITEEKCQTELIENALKNFNQIDILVNNAGTIVSKPALETSMEIYDRILDVNLRAAVSLSVMALPHLIKTKGNIVNISSVAAKRPSAGNMCYCISKAGMDMMTKSLSFEMAPHGVRVNSVNPGGVPTNIFREQHSTLEKRDALLKKLAKLHPLGRNGEVHEVCDAIIFLASNNASFITGQLLCVDGGATTGGVSFN